MGVRPDSWRCAAQVMASQKQIEVKYKAAQQAAVRCLPLCEFCTQAAFGCVYTQHLIISTEKAVCLD